MAAAGEYDYRLPRRALPEVIDLCALPWNDPSREARNGKVLGGRQLLIGIEDVEITRWESAFFCGERETGQVWRERRSRRRESGLKVPGSLL